MSDETIVIIGAGVLGLSTALHLQETLTPRPKLLIIAQYAPGDESIDYATPWSGAHYRPIPDSSPQGLFEASLAEKTYAHFKTYALTYPEAGIRFMPGVEMLESPPAAYVNLDGRYSAIDDFRVLRKEELAAGAQWGASYTTYCVNTPVYIAHLLRRYLLNGGLIVKKRVDGLEDAFAVAGARDGTATVRTVVNCSGTAMGLVNDPKCFITRGQTCLVTNAAPSPSTQTRQNSDGTWTFVIPRPLHGGTIIGGTKEERDMEDRPRAETRRVLLEKAAKAFPELLDATGRWEVVRDIVGRRPSREGGMR
ncbi:D-amino-acid oxidase, partial [Lachnellula subtilissima]